MTKILFVAYVIVWAVLALYIAYNFGKEYRAKKRAEYEQERYEWMQEIRRRVAYANEQANGKG